MGEDERGPGIGGGLTLQLLQERGEGEAARDVCGVKVGRPDIDAFEAMMMREERTLRFFVAFDYTEDAFAEIGAFFKRTGKTIRALTVKDILDEAKLGMKLA